MSAAVPGDVLTAMRFGVEIWLPGARRPLCDGAFATCDGLEMSLDVRSVREGGDASRQRLMAGPASYGRVTLRRGMTGGADLWDWCARVLREPNLRADARVVMLDGDGEKPRAAFLLQNCLPVRVRGRRLDALGDGVALEELELACERLVLERPGGEPAPRPAALARAELRELDLRMEREVNRDRWVRAPLNPESVRMSLASTGGAGVATLAVELVVGSAHAGPGADVRRLSRRIAYFLEPRKAEGEREPLPPPVRFVWGAVRFDGQVVSIEESLEAFSGDGVPQRAALSLRPRRDRVAEEPPR